MCWGNPLNLKSRRITNPSPCKIRAGKLINPKILKNHRLQTQKPCENVFGNSPKPEKQTQALAKTVLGNLRTLGHKPRKLARMCLGNPLNLKSRCIASPCKKRAGKRTNPKKPLSTSPSPRKKHAGKLINPKTPLATNPKTLRGCVWKLC